MVQIKNYYALKIKIFNTTFINNNRYNNDSTSTILLFENIKNDFIKDRCILIDTCIFSNNYNQLISLYFNDSSSKEK